MSKSSRRFLCLALALGFGFLSQGKAAFSATSPEVVLEDQDTVGASASAKAKFGSVDRVSVLAEGSGERVFIKGRSLPKPQVQKISSKKLLLKFSKTRLKIPSKIVTGGKIVRAVRSSLHEGNEAWVVLDTTNFENFEIEEGAQGLYLDLSTGTGNSMVGSSASERALELPDSKVAKDSGDKRFLSRLIDVSVKPSEKGLKIVLTSDGSSKYTVRKLQRPEKLILRFHNTKLEEFKSDSAPKGKENSEKGLLGLEMRQIGPAFAPFTEAIFTLVAGTKSQIDRDLNQVIVTLEAPGQVEKAGEKKGNLSQLVSLDIEGAELSLVVKTLASEANFDVDIVSGALTGTVNEKFKDIPFKSALALLLSPSGYDYEVQGNSLRIGTAVALRDSKTLMPQVTELINPVGGMLPATFDQFVRTILRPTNAVLTVIDVNRNALILKGTPADIQEYKRAIRDLKLDESAGDDRITRIIKLNYADASQMSGILTPYLTPAGRITIRGTDPTSSQDYNQLVIRETSGNMGVLLELIKELDIKAPQVLIESNIIEVNDQKDLNLGINWSAVKNTGDPTISSSFAQTGPVGAGNFSFGTIKSGLNISASLQALESKKKGKVISRPRIATASGRLATINTVENVIVSTTNQTISNGVVTNVTTFTQLPLPITLSVTPYITDDGRITTNILATITSQSGPGIGGAPPPTNTQTASTRITTKNGETIVIGGLVRELVQDTVNGIPILSSLPIIGALFQSHEKNTRKVELVIFITPTILED